MVWLNFTPKTLKFRSFREFRPLGPHQGFALDPLGALRRPPDPMPLIINPRPPNQNSLIRPWTSCSKTCLSRVCNLSIILCKLSWKVSLNPYESCAEIVYTTCDIQATYQSVSLKWSSRDPCGVRFAFLVDWIKCTMSTNSYKVLSSIHLKPNHVFDNDRKGYYKCLESVLYKS